MTKRFKVMYNNEIVRFTNGIYNYAFLEDGEITQLFAGDKKAIDFKNELIAERKRCLQNAEARLDAQTNNRDEYEAICKNGEKIKMKLSSLAICPNAFLEDNVKACKERLAQAENMQIVKVCTEM